MNSGERQVCEHLRLPGPGGCFVFNPIHNAQARLPIENLLAMYEAVAGYGKYPHNAITSITWSSR
jgi:hypothetical protein